MRKIIVFILTLALIVSMAVSAYAVTPKWEYKPVKIPEIKVDSNFVQKIVNNWFKDHPINITFTAPCWVEGNAMEIPKNCRECQHYEKCHAPHYGGTKCQYEKAIAEATLANMKKG